NERLSGFTNNKIEIDANISSQFISALLLIAPVLPDGLEIELLGNVSSEPYIKMTLEIMRHFGISSKWNKNIIKVKKQKYLSTEYSVEADWSAAAYWYSMVALSDNAAIFLKGLKSQSLQGDSIIKELFLPFGVVTEFSNTGVFITKEYEELPSTPQILDFSANPDIAQTIIVVCAAKKANYKFTGLESLRIKETDRIQALQNELKKYNIDFFEETKGIYKIEGTFNASAVPLIESYNDHRMLMSFAPLALCNNKIMLSNPTCVKKSYPDFWNDIKMCGFKIL
ncbi:MAG: 3-phosphoshikimate 1-carboxyvinyltransferase, partial [Bacteroidetes bacterium]|nr:3-phosphoshikimate 1-carboxyvinyltransferase [Bacteroidota bacterium]